MRYEYTSDPGDLRHHFLSVPHDAKYVSEMIISIEAFLRQLSQEIPRSLEQSYVLRRYGQ